MVSAAAVAAAVAAAGAAAEYVGCHVRSKNAKLSLTDEIMVGGR
jgi:hypothetical protein